MLIHTPYLFGFHPRTPEFLQLAIKPSGSMKKVTKQKNKVSAPTPDQSIGINGGLEEGAGEYKDIISDVGRWFEEVTLSPSQRETSLPAIKLVEIELVEMGEAATTDKMEEIPLPETEASNPPPVLRHASVWNCCTFLGVLKGFRR